MNQSILKSTAVLMTLFVFNTAGAQEYSPNRWKETRRFNLRDEPVQYTDTVFVNTTDRQVIDVVIGGYAYKGTINQDSLNIGSRTFHVVKNEEDELRLKFDKLIHVFSRELKGMEGADAPEFAEKNRIPDLPLTAINQKQLYGSWLVYKKVIRENVAADVKNIPYFKKLEVYKPIKKGNKGFLVLASNIAWKITGIKGGDIMVNNTLGQPVVVRVLRQSENELLLEDAGNVVYFLKKH
jgi:hypothetical protein